MQSNISKNINFLHEDLIKWRNRKSQPVTLINERLRQLSEKHSGLLVFEVNDGEVLLNTNVQQSNASLLYRSSVYLDFLKTVFKEFGRSKHYTFGFYVDDNDLHSADFPIFSFQKHRTSDNILLPDIDFFLYDFYESSDYLDAIPFSEKTCGAVFVGATTGAPLTIKDGEPLRTISEKLLLESRVPRINSALNFRGSSDIYFDLPVIVQSDGEKTTNKLVAMGFGSGKKAVPQ